MKEKTKNHNNSKHFYIFLQPIMQIIDQVYQKNETAVPEEKLKIYATFMDRYNDFVKNNIIPVKTYSKTEFDATELFYINVIKHLEQKYRVTFSKYLPKMLHLRQECKPLESIAAAEQDSLTHLTMDETFADKIKNLNEENTLYADIIHINPGKDRIIMEIDNNIKNALKENLEAFKGALGDIFKSSLLDFYLYSIISDLKTKNILTDAVTHEIDKQFDNILNTEDACMKKKHIIKLHNFIKDALKTEKSNSILSKTIHDILQGMQSITRTIKGSNKIAGSNEQFFNKESTIH